MPRDDDGQDNLFAPIGNAMPKIKPLTPVQRRLMEAAVREEAQKILFQHTVLAQTSLPYRDPGGVREWRREQGAVSLKIDAGELMPIRMAQQALHVVLARVFGPWPDPTSRATRTDHLQDVVRS
jgi:hypothetical protein